MIDNRYYLNLEMANANRKILVAVDESQESVHALRWALQNLILVTNDHAHDLLILLYVHTHSHVLLAPRTLVTGYEVTPDMIEIAMKNEEESSKVILSEVKRICDENKVTSEMKVAFGDPREAICEEVEKLRVDYLVMGSHGYGALKRAFLGSVSDFCSHNAKCPVIIVKNQ